MRTIIAPHGTNGRGIVQVGNVLYYTSASSNDVWGYNIVSNTDLGSIFTVAGEPALASLASDGPNLYIQAYSTSRRVYKYTLGGSLVWSRHICPSGSTIHPNSACDGLEYSSGKLISNRGDGVKPYDVYGTNGSLLTPAFIVDPNAQNNTGIACDGTNYYVSRIYGQIAVYDLNGVYQNMITLNGGTEIEDISVTRKGGKC